VKIRYFFSFIIILFSFFIVHTADAQIGGRHAFPFIEQPVSARVAALGGNVVAINDGDINLGYVNPSLINEQMNNIISLAYVDFFSDINYGYAQYGHSFEKIGSFVATVQYNNYGKFDYADETGSQEGGTFSASDASLNIGWGRLLGEKFSIGSTFKLINSHYESYNSFGFGIDVAGSYFSKTGWQMSLVARNIGAQLTTFVSGERNPLPFDLQYTVTKRLEHLPFRFSVIYDHIEKWNLSYDDPSNPSEGYDPVTGEPVYNSGFSKFADNLLRHFIIGGEVYIGKNVILRGGYNYRRRQELKLNNKPGMAGFSWGFGVRIYKFKINYARTTFNQNGSPNYITLVFDMESFLKK
jgi:hypothetical protein